MIHVLISGALGSMGHQLAQAIEADPDFTVVSGVDIRSDDTLPYPVYQGFGGVKEDPDVLIDFSRADALEAVLEFATEKKIPTVICTTGHTPRKRPPLPTQRSACRSSIRLTPPRHCAHARSGAPGCANPGQRFDMEIVETPTTASWTRPAHG
ncbi:MAG: hypothetical protein ACLUO4_01945 [Christensenellales bacterium]